MTSILAAPARPTLTVTRIERKIVPRKIHSIDNKIPTLLYLVILLANNTKELAAPVCKLFTTQKVPLILTISEPHFTQGKISSLNSTTLL